VIYLTTAGARADAVELGRVGIGLMLTPASGVRVATARLAPCWAADNGCFAQGARFDLAAYLAWLAAMLPVVGTCLFASAPDVLGDAGATWARSRPVLPELRALGYPAALVAQDGWDGRAVDWDAFDVLFIGGTDAFKLAPAGSAAIAEGKARGRWVHVGRVNSWRRLAAMTAAGADSSDGTTLAYNRRRYLPEVAGWGRRLRGLGQGRDPVFLGRRGECLPPRRQDLRIGDWVGGA